MTERDVVEFQIAGIPHRAVILRVIPEKESCLLIYGTGTVRDDVPHVLVAPNSPDSRMIGLYKPTYFYAGHLRHVMLRLLRPVNAKCTPGCFTKLRLLVMEHAPEAMRLLLEGDPPSPDS